MRHLRYEYAQRSPVENATLPHPDRWPPGHYLTRRPRCSPICTTQDLSIGLLAHLARLPCTDSRKTGSSSCHTGAPSWAPSSVLKRRIKPPPSSADLSLATQDCGFAAQWARRFKIFRTDPKNLQSRCLHPPPVTKSRDRAPPAAPLAALRAYIEQVGPSTRGWKGTR